jgi:hypothetical protein
MHPKSWTHNFWGVFYGKSETGCTVIQLAERLKLRRVKLRNGLGQLGAQRERSRKLATGSTPGRDKAAGRTAMCFLGESIVLVLRMIFVYLVWQDLGRSKLNLRKTKRVQFLATCLITRKDETLISC